MYNTHCNSVMLHVFTALVLFCFEKTTGSSCLTVLIVQLFYMSLFRRTNTGVCQIIMYRRDCDVLMLETVFLLVSPNQCPAVSFRLLRKSFHVHTACNVAGGHNCCRINIFTPLVCFHLRDFCFAKRNH